jgi:hypothetical protein
MDNLLSSIYLYVDPVLDLVEPVRIAILDSGLDPENPFLIEDQQLANPRIKEARNFVHGTGPHDIRDEIGHGTPELRDEKFWIPVPTMTLQRQGACLCIRVEFLD